VSAPIPDDALVMARVEVVQYVNGQGQVWWNIDHMTPISTHDGLWPSPKSGLGGGA
jgi:hypothetical protein